MTIIGVAGTAKNTGKTTTLGALVRSGLALHVPLGITGIGYDGEERDTVTQLPKPRIMVEPGMVVSTSVSCLGHSTARGEIIERTGFFTPLGEVVLLRIVAPGTMVIAGPNTTAQLRSVCTLMEREDAAIVFVDGSLNRIVPMAVADAVVFATGASRSTDTTVVVQEMQGIEGLFSLPRSREAQYERSGIWMVGQDVCVHLARSLVHGKGEMERAVRWMPDDLRAIGVPGVVTLEGLSILVAERERRRGDVDILIDDPMKMLVAGDPWRVWSTMCRLHDAGASVCYRTRPSLAAVTVNPTYPAFDGTTYVPARCEGGRLLNAVRSALGAFVTDIIAEQGAGQILERCLSRSNTHVSSRRWIGDPADAAGA